MTHAKKETINRETTIMAIAWPTDKPWVRNVLGVCQVDTLSAPLQKMAYVSKEILTQAMQDRDIQRLGAEEVEPSPCPPCRR